MNIGEMIDGLYALKSEKTALNAKLSDLNKQIEAAEHELKVTMGEAGLNMGRGKTCSVTIAQSQVPKVEDWQAFYEYIVESGSPYLLQRRINASAWGELIVNGETIPGTVSETKTTIATRKI